MSRTEPQIQLHVVGIAPSRPVPPRLFCTGRFMRKLVKVMGIDYREYLQRFNRWNLYEGVETNQPSQGIDRLAALRLLNKIAAMGPRHVIFACGNRVATALIQVATKNNDSKLELLQALEGPYVKLIHIPHPSGRCRLWNDPTIESTVRTALLDAYAQAGIAQQLTTRK